MPKYYMPVGNTNFQEIRETGLYYIDKTMLINHLVQQMRAKVTLFTRPRRFGKTLNMSMLESFFDIRKDSKEIFEGLQITDNKELCESWMNQYPTIFISFKDVGGVRFNESLTRLKSIISKLYETHIYLIKENKNIENFNIRKYRAFLEEDTDKVDITDALFLLTKLMYDYYKKTIIILIDEYDVPMAKGDANGYYREITDVIRYMLSKALKDNSYLKFAVLTGCLRIAKESIFTGLNNLKNNSIMDNEYEECFGFTDKEIDRLLLDTGLTEYKGKIKQWYDGYHFGDNEVYCPWDVLNYVSDLQRKPGIAPKNYWVNTSGNDIIRKYLDTGMNPNEDFEILLKGGTICKTIYEDVTYENLVSSEENFWSVLYMTGYLTAVPNQEFIHTLDRDDDYVEDDKISLKLVNNEIKDLFARTISRWFRETIVKDDRKSLFEAIWRGDAESLTNVISDYLYDTISYYDYNENFYHAFLAGLFSGVKNLSVESNRETGKGRADIIIKDTSRRYVAIFELKRAKNDDEMSKLCDEALQQIENNKYYTPYKRETVFKYGIVFSGKDCLVKKA